MNRQVLDHVTTIRSVARLVAPLIAGGRVVCWGTDICRQYNVLQDTVGVRCGANTLGLTADGYCKWLAALPIILLKSPRMSS
jgi:hypothetical protein